MTHIRWQFFVAAAGFALSGSASAQVPVASAEDKLAAAFGAMPEVQQVSLSPDGTKAAIVSPLAKGGQVVLIVDLVKGGMPKPIVRAPIGAEHLQRCDWATDTRLVCRISVIAKTATGLLGFTRLTSMNSDGSDSKLLTAEAGTRALGPLQHGGSVIDWLGGAPGRVLMTRQYVPENTNNTRIASEADGLGVESVDVVSLARKGVEPARREAADYISDGKGTVRLMASVPSTEEGFVLGRTDYFYRKPGSRAWQSLSRVVSADTGGSIGFEPVAVDSDLNVAYGFNSKDGFLALYRRKLDGSNADELLLSRSGADVDQLVRIGRADRVVGASYATERRTVEFFDPVLKSLGAALGKALPDQPTIEFLDSSADESHLLLLASSDRKPGQLYVYDKPTHHLEELLPVRPALETVAMGEMKPISYPAADGTSIPGYLTLPPGSTGKNLPAIVMPHGGPGARDEWGFDWLVQFFASRGFAVLQPNFRGSTGYGTNWYQRNGFQSWRTSIGDVNDAGRWLQSQGIAAPGKLAIFGWSYGGYAALQSAVLDPKLFKAIVAVAPVTDLETLRSEAANFTSYKQVDRFIGHGPYVREGSPAQNVNTIVAPVLMFHGDRDQNVGIGESRLMEQRLRAAGKQVQLIEFPGLAHSLEDSAARTRLLKESDAFLRRNLGLSAD